MSDKVLNIPPLPFGFLYALLLNVLFLSQRHKFCKLHRFSNPKTNFYINSGKGKSMQENKDKSAT